MDDTLYNIIRYLIGTILVLSVTDKIKNRKSSSLKMEAYKILPLIFIKPFTVLFLLVEIYLFLAFLIKQPNILDISLFVILMSIYTLAISINIYKGNIRISCGCGGVLESNRLTPFLIYRNTTLIVLALSLLTAASTIETSILENTHAFLLALTLVMAYGALMEFNQQKYIIEKVKSKLPFFA